MANLLLLAAMHLRKYWIHIRHDRCEEVHDVCAKSVLSFQGARHIVQREFQRSQRRVFVHFEWQCGKIEFSDIGRRCVLASMGMQLIIAAIWSAQGGIIGNKQRRLLLGVDCMSMKAVDVLSRDMRKLCDERPRKGPVTCKLKPAKVPSSDVEQSKAVADLWVLWVADNEVKQNKKCHDRNTSYYPEWRAWNDVDIGGQF